MCFPTLIVLKIMIMFKSCHLYVLTLTVLSFSLPDEPFPPGQPKVKEQDRDHITVSWEPPENNGGAPITGYEVERKEPKSNRWVKVMLALQVIAIKNTHLRSESVICYNLCQNNTYAQTSIYCYKQYMSEE